MSHFSCVTVPTWRSSVHVVVLRELWLPRQSQRDACPASQRNQSGVMRTDRRPLYRRRSVDVELRESADDLHGVEADGDEALEEFDGVLGIVHGLGGPEVGGVDDTGFLVGLHALAFDDPFEGGLAIDHVGVGVEGDVANGDAGVVDDRALVRDFLAGLWVLLLAELHLDYAIVGGGEAVDGRLVGVEGDGCLSTVS